MTTAKIVTALIACAFVAAVQAQELTLSEVKSKGVLFKKAEVETAFIGSTIRYLSGTTKAPVQFSASDDGKFTGSITGRNNSNIAIRGTWRITDDGQFCRAQEQRGQTENFCWAVWKVGDKLYRTDESDAPLEFTISK